MTQGRIVIDSERCKGCELCTSVCPQHVLAMSGVFNSSGYLPAQLLDPAGACTGCGVCAIICPDTAITVFRETVKQPRTKPALLLDGLGNREAEGNQEPALVRFGSQFSPALLLDGLGNRAVEGVLDSSTRRLS